jgi:hypothetical protein
VSKRIAFRKMLSIPDSTTDAQADVIIEAYHRGVERARETGRREGQDSLAYQLRILLGIEEL